MYSNQLTYIVSFLSNFSLFNTNFFNVKLVQSTVQNRSNLAILAQKKNKYNVKIEKKSVHFFYKILFIFYKKEKDK